jgi:predicted SprT family Zn-dependent metalloprotease
MKLYATTKQAESIEGTTKPSRCDCGESYAIEWKYYETIVEVVVCDSCNDNAPNFEKF